MMYDPKGVYILFSFGLMTPIVKIMKNKRFNKGSIT